MSSADTAAGVENTRIEAGVKPVQRRRVLLIAYHYPPCLESSGYLRALAFSRHLPDCGWDCAVLAASPKGYAKWDARQYELVPRNTPVVRAWARDASCYFSIRGKYPGILAAPDRWSSWWLPAALKGLHMMRRFKPDVIWATQPNPTAFWVACTLHRLTGVPWVADFRDPIAAADGNGWARRACRRLEARTCATCARFIFTAPAAARDYARRYPQLGEERISVIPNGYEESDFSDLMRPLPSRTNKPVVIVHSGVLYPEGRDPRPLFSALATLKSKDELSGHDVKIIFRGAGREQDYAREIDACQVGDIIEFKPAVSHAEALAEVCQADGLLVLQGGIHNGQIPAKVYEYMRAQKPILALSDSAGDTADALRGVGIGTIVSIDDDGAIASALGKFVDSIRRGTGRIAGRSSFERYSRAAGSHRLAKVFEQVLESKTNEGECHE